MTLKVKILDSVLKSFFDEKEISELKKFLSNKAITRSKAGIRKTKSVSSKYKQQIETLISYAISKLTKQKQAEFLFYLGEVLITRGEFDYATKIYFHILKITGKEKELESVRAYSYYTLGDIFSRQAKWKESINYTRQAKKIFEKEKDYKGCSQCENLLGTIYGDKSDIKRTRFHFEKSLSYLDPKTDFNLIGAVENNLGIIYSIQGSHNDALIYYKRALTRFERTGNHRRIGELRNNLGMYFINTGDYASALNEFDISISVHNKAEFLPTLAISYLSKSYIYTLLKDYRFAVAFLEKSKSICTKINDRLSIAELYKIKGIIQRDQKKYTLAEKSFRTSLKINIEYDNKMNQAETYFELAFLYLEKNNYYRAIDCWKKALKYYRKINNDWMISKIQLLIKANRSKY